MSSKPPSSQHAGIPKSAAKKRSKKAARPPASNPATSQAINADQATAATTTTAAPVDHHHHLQQQHQQSTPSSLQHPSSQHSSQHAAAAHAAAASHPIDPTLFNFPPGAYPAEFTYESGHYYDDGAVPPPGSANSPFSLPFPFDYSNFGTGHQANGIGGGFNITHEDLIQTANELYRRMADPDFGSDDAYWSSLPPHLRQFIREAVPYSGSAPTGQARGTVSEGQQGMWTMAQQIVNAASQGMGLGPGVGANLLAGVNGRQYTQPGLGEELGFRRHPDAKEDEYDEDEEFDLEEPGYVAPVDGEAPKKKNKKKKKKNASAAAAAAAAAQAAAAAADQQHSLLPPNLRQPPRQPIPPHPSTQTTLHPPPPPAVPAPVHPPPSSRAAGKQPMAVPAAGQAPARSARAAGKAPASAAPAHSHPHHSHPPPKPAGKGKAPANQPPAKIWTQASIEDREHIRLFWLSLNEAERRDLLQIEKDAVLRKMKEQHRHACNCSVCGRKKVNIESELDQLYEQYYDELQHYAAEQRSAAIGRVMPPPGSGPFPGSVEVDATGKVTKLDHRAPDPRAIAEDDLIDDASEAYDDDEGYDDEDDLDDDDIGSDEADVGDDLDDPHPQPLSRHKAVAKSVAPRADGSEDFVGFGNNLATIKGILTVADDLLKNDGVRFLEMMEQLAVARSIREEQSVRDLQDETDDDFDDQDEPVSEAERMEEGKRMFQIFAARMFEQRVLQAYREKVAKQREEQLLRELEEEDSAKRAKEEKKAKELQKKKDKKRLQKQKADEERIAREEAAAAEAAEAKAKAEQAERDRQRKAEEERARREAVKRAAQEEQAKVAAERKKRQQEEKEREEEAARKKREREEKARKEREAREKEAKERERREREERTAKEKADKAEKDRLAKEKAEKDRLAKEAKDKADKERTAKAEEERVEKAKRDEATRKEREAAEQAKVLAAQQAQRERAKADKEKAAAAATAATAASAAATSDKAAAIRTPVPVAVRSNGPASPVDHPSPVKSAGPPGAAVRPPVRPAQQKTPQPYFSQPVPPVGFTNRIPVPPSLAPGYRAPFNQSPVFSPPQPSGSASISPGPPARAFAEPSASFDIGQRTAPIGMGFPPVKTARMPSVDEAFSPPTAPIGTIPARTASGGEIGDEFRSASKAAPIAPPGPIGRPSAYLDSPATTSASARSKSPAQPEQVFGSAALGADDEIVQPARRNMSNGWDTLGIPPAAPGAGRWSTSPATSIWGAGAAAEAPSTWAAPGRQPSFGGIGSAFAPTPASLNGPGAIGSVGSVGSVGGVGAVGAGAGVGVGVGSPASAFGGIFGAPHPPHPASQLHPHTHNHSPHH